MNRRPNTRSAPRLGETGPASPFSSLVIVALVILALRILSLWFNNSQLFFDEAQYWAWSQEPAFGYFSKPPMLAWLIGAFTGVCGDSEFCIRLVSPVFHTATAFVLYGCAKLLFDARTGFWTGLIWLTLPAVSLSSTLVSTDVPLLFFWSVALYAVIRLVRENALIWALLLAVALGFGLLSKYAMAYFLLCAIIWSLASGERPLLLSRPLFWLAMLAGAAFLLPNIAWNAANGFVTASHTGDNIGWRGEMFNPDRLAEFFGSQFGVLGPILFGVYLVAVFRLFREGMNRQQGFLLAFSLPVLVLICAQAFVSKAYANWGATAYPAAVILLADLMVNHMPAVWNRISLAIHGFVFALLSIAVAFAEPGQLPLEGEANPFNRMWGSREAAGLVIDELEKGGYTHVLTAGRKQSATMVYYLRERPEPVVAWRPDAAPQDHFELTRALQDMPAETLEDAVFLFHTRSAAISGLIANSFERTLPVGDRLFRLEGYRGSGIQGENPGSGRETGE